MNAREEFAPQKPDAAEAPTSDRPSVRGMSLQLYLLPLLIVVLLLGGWMFVAWLLHEDQDPLSLVRGMQEPGRRSWQKAFALSQLLHDPSHDALKDDVSLCRELVAVLERQNELAAASETAGADEEHARFRVFLCRALGEFRLPDGLPTLLATADSATGPHGVAIRAAALEAIAVLVGHIGSDAMAANPSVLRVVLSASYDETSSDEQLPVTATYVLGILGGPEALERLMQLLDDPRQNVRYNAATGLARHGNVQALPVLCEMLDPQTHRARHDEQADTAGKRRQTLIISNGIRAAERLAAVAPPMARQNLRVALQRLGDSRDIPAQVRLQAKEAFLRLHREQ